MLRIATNWLLWIVKLNTCNFKTMFKDLLRYCWLPEGTAAFQLPSQPSIWLLLTVMPSIYGLPLLTTVMHNFVHWYSSSCDDSMPRVNDVDLFRWILLALLITAAQSCALSWESLLFLLDVTLELAKLFEYIHHLLHSGQSRFESSFDKLQIVVSPSMLEWVVVVVVL